MVSIECALRAQLCTERDDCPSLVEWLHSEAKVGHAKAVAYLFRDGADIDATVDDGTNALHVAVDKGHVNVVKILLSGGCNIDAQTVESKSSYRDPFVEPPIGWTAIHIAAARVSNKYADTT